MGEILATVLFIDDEEDCTQRLFEQGLTDFIRKPYRLTELVEKLKSLLGH